MDKNRLYCSFCLTRGNRPVSKSGRSSRCLVVVAIDGGSTRGGMGAVDVEVCWCGSRRSSSRWGRIEGLLQGSRWRESMRTPAIFAERDGCVTTPECGKPARRQSSGRNGSSSCQTTHQNRGTDTVRPVSSVLVHKVYARYLRLCTDDASNGFSRLCLRLLLSTIIVRKK